MNLRQLELFVAIVQTGSFSGGAEAASLTQSTVSQHIAALEDEIGMPLFDRVGRGVVLTAGGRLFLQHARRILAEREALSQAMHSFQGLEQASLTIGASNIPANYMIPTLLPRLREKHPGIILTMVTGASAEMLQALQENEVELALVGSHVAGKTVDFIPLRNDPLVLVVSCEHSWARQGRIALEQLFAEPLIVRERGSGSGQALESALSQAGHDPARLNIGARLGSNEAVLQATASGFGCAFVSELSVQKWSASGDLRSVEIEGFAIDRWIWLATLQGRSLSPAAQAFVEFLKACCRD